MVTWPGFSLEGREMLPQPPSQLPELSEEDNECRKNMTRVNAIVLDKMFEPLLSCHSSWDRLRKGIAWLVRFKKYLIGCAHKDLSSVPKGPLSVVEVLAAESNILRAVQREAFPNKLPLLAQKESGSQKNCLPKSSPLRNLSPVLVDGMLRVGGRLENAPVLPEVMHPAILPSKHHVTNLVIQNCHCQQGHCGPCQVLAFTRQRFWIVRGLSAVRRDLTSCMECRK